MNMGQIEINHDFESLTMASEVNLQTHDFAVEQHRQWLQTNNRVSRLKQILLTKGDDNEN